MRPLLTKLRAVTDTRILPFLTVRNAARAIEFYKEAFGAEELSRLETPTGQIVAELAIDGAPINVTDENPEGHNLSPETLGGTSVRVDLVVADPDAVALRAVAAGAKELYPIADQPYGWRQGRVIDPFGHHWLIGRPLEAD
jgi:PhnB protein